MPKPTKGPRLGGSSSHQKAILANQAKLDKVLKNQDKITANQEKILANQKKILAK